MAITIADGFTALEDVKKDISDLTDAVKIRAGNYINQLFYTTWYNEEPEKFITTQTINVVANTSTYALTSTVETISLPGCGLFDLNSDGTDADLPITKTGFGSNTPGFYLNGGNIVLTPVPKIADTYKLRYIPSLTLLTTTTSTTGTLVVPDRFKELVRDALLVWYDVNDEDPGMESLDDPRYARTLENFRSLIRRDSAVEDAIDSSSAY